jgi:hypothetical protein
MLDNRRRIYALATWSVEKRVRGWYIKRTDFEDEWRGPFRSATSACLMIARGLRIELVKRDRLAS